MILTAARLVAGLGLGVVGAGFGWLILPDMPTMALLPQFLIVCTVLGLACGWMILGRRAGRGYVSSVGIGLTAAAATVFWIILLQSGYRMMRQSTGGRYRSLGDGVMDVFDIALETGQLVLAPVVLAVLIGGGIVAGLLTEAAARSWK